MNGETNRRVVFQDAFHRQNIPTYRTSLSIFIDKRDMLKFERGDCILICLRPTSRRQMNHSFESSMSRSYQYSSVLEKSYQNSF